MKLIMGRVSSKAGGTADPEICFGLIRCPGWKISDIKKKAAVSYETSIEGETPPHPHTPSGAGNLCHM